MKMNKVKVRSSVEDRLAIINRASSANTTTSVSVCSDIEERLARCRMGIIRDEKKEMIASHAKAIMKSETTTLEGLESIAERAKRIIALVHEIQESVV